MYLNKAMIFGNLTRDPEMKAGIGASSVIVAMTAQIADVMTPPTLPSIRPG